MSKEILCRWKLFGKQWTKWFFPSWKAQENRSWINFEDLLRSLPILHFYSLHVRVLLTLMCRSAIFLPNASFSVSAFFFFFDSHNLKLTLLLHSCPTHYITFLFYKTEISFCVLFAASSTIVMKVFHPATDSCMFYVP